PASLPKKTPSRRNTTPAARKIAPVVVPSSRVACRLGPYSVLPHASRPTAGAIERLVGAWRARTPTPEKTMLIATRKTFIQGPLFWPTPTAAAPAEPTAATAKETANGSRPDDRSLDRVLEALMRAAAPRRRARAPARGGARSPGPLRGTSGRGPRRGSP